MVRTTMQTIPSISLAESTMKDNCSSYNYVHTVEPNGHCGLSNIVHYLLPWVY